MCALRNKMPSDLENKITQQIQKFEKKEISFNDMVLEIKRLKLFELTIEDVLRHPLKYSKGGFGEIISDMQVLNPEKLTEKQRKSYAFLLPAASMLSAGIWAMPHELLHAAVNKATGGKNLEIVLNKMYGADFWHAIFPQIESKFMIPILGGYVRAQPANEISSIAVTLAPYVMTPIGIYFMQNALKKQNTKYWLIGSGLMVSHAGGVIGDFFALGQKITQKICTTIYKSPQQIEQNKEQHTDSFADNMAISAALVFGFLIGNRIMGYSYRLSKGLLNSARKYFCEKT